MKKKCVAVGIILLFIGISIIPSTAQDMERTSLQSVMGRWWYAGGSGHGNKQIKVYNNLQNNGFSEYVFTLNVFLFDSLNETVPLNSSEFSISVSAKYFIGGYSYKLYDSAGLFLSTVFPFTISGIPISEIKSWFRGEFINGLISIKATGWGFGKIIIRIHTV